MFLFYFSQEDSSLDKKNDKSEDNKIEDEKEVRSYITYACRLIVFLAILNLFGLLAPTWLFITTLVSIAIFIYENYSKWNNKWHVALILVIFFGLGAYLRLKTGLDAFLIGVKPQDCLQEQPPGVFLGGCGPEPTLKVGEHLNDTLSLLALAWAIGLYLKKK